MDAGRRVRCLDEWEHLLVLRACRRVMSVLMSEVVEEEAQAVGLLCGEAEREEREWLKFERELWALGLLQRPQ
eukprot:COSAG02_NODE_742_length_17794_cov_22.222718_9_plen_73_part_00